MALYQKKWFQKLGNVKHTVACQICGKKLKELGNHIVRAHNISIESYQMEYPLSPLVSEMTSRNKSNASSARPIPWQRTKKLIRGNREHIKDYSVQMIKRARQSYGTSRKVTVQCSFCGKPILIKKSKLKKHKLHFCSIIEKGKFERNIVIEKGLTKNVLVSLYVKRGKSMEEIGKKFGTTHPTVSRMLKYYGIPRRKSSQWIKTARGRKIMRKLSESQIKKISKLISQGKMSYIGASRKLRVGYLTVRMRVKRYRRTGHGY